MSLDYKALLFLGCVSSVLLTAVGQTLPDIKLQPLRVNKKLVTLSGFSSGGTFAQQLQISHSKLFSGIAVFSHTYYRCGPGNGVQKDYDDVCTKLGKLPEEKLYDPNKAMDDIASYRRQNLIDDPSNLRGKKLYVFAGLRNFLFTTEMSLRILRIYEPLIRNPLRIRTRVMDAMLLLPSDSPNFDNCTSPADKKSFIGNCGLSGPLEALQFLMAPSIINKPGRITLQPLNTFDQREFFIKERHDMDDTGFVYIPRNCRQQMGRNHGGHSGFGGGSGRSECYLHFYFHGCFTGRDFEGANHTIRTGFLEIAETNNIIVVFPQAVKSKENDIGCWDTYGFTGAQYATKNGAQVQVVRKILARVLGEDISFGAGSLQQRSTSAPFPSFPHQHPEHGFPDYEGFFP